MHYACAIILIPLDAFVLLIAFVLKFQHLSATLIFVLQPERKAIQITIDNSTMKVKFTVSSRSNAWQYHIVQIIEGYISQLNMFYLYLWLTFLSFSFLIISSLSFLFLSSSCNWCCRCSSRILSCSSNCLCFSTSSRASRSSTSNCVNKYTKLCINYMSICIMIGALHLPVFLG